MSPVAADREPPRPSVATAATPSSSPSHLDQLLLAETDAPTLWKPAASRRAHLNKGPHPPHPARGNAPRPKFKTHGHHQSHAKGISMLELRRERDLWLAGQQELLISKSAPAPSSWPPAGRVADENQHPNRWRGAAAGGGGLSSSAPRESPLSRSHGGSSTSAKRVMTLFESAAFFNESGNLLNQDDLEQLGSSPGDPSKRKPKRRVGRRKAEKGTPKRDAGGATYDSVNQEEIVLELMAQLLPHVDVGKELNLLLLTGTPRGHANGGGVFLFEEDDAAAAARRGAKARNAELEVDLLKFQAALTKMLFEASEPAPLALESDDLLEQCCSEPWLTRAVLDTVKLDPRAQHDRFAVLLAVFRAMHHRRRALLDAAAATALAIYHHQGANATSGRFADVELVGVKGLASFLAGVLSTLETESVHAVGGDNEDENAQDVHAHCDALSRAVTLLLRSAPGKPRRQDENNQLEKFDAASESLEATTYGALGEVVYRLAAFSPPHGEALLRWLLRKWPARNVQLQLFFLRFTGGLLARFFRYGLCFPSDAVRSAFARIASAARSPHFLLAKEACAICEDLPLMDVHLSRDRALRELVASALHESARAHWNPHIRELADERFDMLLDLA
ncbi:hypothetical protein PybrP1_011774 [[Pythium] brassicae (nom. inval.)]|nr:hypothetical protein PybrP1_011774 [[Pythium] brassicae (nom. inval.)]